jgi:tape measure domain-containing protein
MAFDVSLDFNERELLNALEKVGRAADTASGKWERLNRVSQSGGNTNGVTRQINGVVGAANTATTSMLKLGASAGVAFGAFNLGVNALKSAGTSVFNFAKGNITLAASLESVTANFTTYLKSGEKAKVLIKELGRFATDTPFTQAEVFGNAEKLLGFGFAANEVTDTLQRLGDISGGSSEKLGGLVLALGQVRTKQRVQGEELLQFAERGVPIYDALAQAIGKSVPVTQELVTKGKVGFGDLQKAIVLLTDEGGQFAGVLKAQSLTFNGLVSTLTGDFEQLRAAFGTLLLPLLKDVVKAADDLIKGINIEDAAAAFEKLGQQAKPFTDQIGAAFTESVVPALQVFRTEISNIIDRLTDYFASSEMLERSGKIVGVAIQAVSLIFSNMIRTIGFATDAFFDFVTPINDALQPSINALLDVASGLLEKFSELNAATPSVGDGFSRLGGIVATLVGIVGTTLEIVLEFAAGLFGLEGKARSADPILRKFGDAVNFLTTPIRAVVGGLGELVSYVGGLFGLIETAEQRAGRLKSEADKLNAEGRDEEYAQRRADQIAEDKAASAAQEVLVKKKVVQQKKLAQSTAERQKAEKEAAQRDAERSKLAISLIEDETQRLLAEEKARYDEQIADVKRLFSQKGKLTQEGQGLIEAATRQHVVNIDSIEGEAFTKEQEVIAARIENQKKFTEAYISEKQKQVSGQREIDEIDVQISEQQAAAYLARLEKQGESEADIKILQEQFDLLFKRRRLDNEIKFQTALLGTIDQGDTEQIERIKKQIELLQAELSNVQFDIDNPEPIKTDKLRDALKKVKAQILDALGIKDDELGGVLESAGSAFGSLFNAISELNQAEIENNQRAIDKIKEKVSIQQDAVNKELALAEEGKANNLKTEQERLDELLKQQGKYEDEALALREKAAKRALQQEILSQVSNTISAVAKIYNANAGIPIIGAILAGVQIAAMFAGINAAKQKAKAAAVDKYYTGGMLPFGKSDEHGGTGYMVEGTNIMVGGGEMVVNRGDSQEHKEFLHRLNNGNYAGIDLVSRLNSSPMAARNNDLAYYRQASEMVSALPNSSKNNTDRIIEVMNKHQNQTMRQGFSMLLKQGYRVVDKNGNTVHYSSDVSGNKFVTVES